MTTQEAIRLFNNYLQSNHKQRTIESYNYLLSRYERFYAERDLDSISPDEIYTFLESQTHELAKSHPKAAVCPDESLLQFHHRPLLIEHEKSLQYVAAQEILSNAQAGPAQDVGKGNGG